MVTLLAPVVAKAPTYVKVANFPGLYRHARSGRYYACKKLGGIRRERSFGTCDRKIAERRMKEGAPCARKHCMHLELLARMLRDELPERIADMGTMAQAFAALRAYPTIGDFLAYQYVTDLNYSVLTGFSETEFVTPGPGALSGLRKCYANTSRLTDAEVIQLVQERQQECFAAVGVTFPSLPGRPLQLIDVQNLFREVDKYARVGYPQFTSLDGRIRIKQRFRPVGTMLSFWYPPKWGLNGMLSMLPA